MGCWVLRGADDRGSDEVRIWESGGLGRFYNVGKFSRCVDGAAYAKTSRDPGESAENTPYFVAK